MADPLGIPFPGGDLAALVHRPAGPARAGVVLAHGLYSSMQSEKLTRLADALAGAGYLCLRYDARGCGDSPGEVRQTTAGGRRDELLAAADLLARELAPGLPQVYMGSSMGGTAALLAADLRPPAALVTWSAPTDLGDLMRRLNQAERPDLPAMAAEPTAFTLGQVLARTSRVLLVHGQEDEVVPVDQARRGYEAAREPKDLLILPGADHRLSRLEDQEAATARTLAWIAARLADRD